MMITKGDGLELLKKVEDAPLIMSKHLPSYLIPFHCEGWGMTSINILVGFHQASVEALVDLRKCIPITNDT
jgi:hypothetical protein